MTGRAWQAATSVPKTRAGGGMMPLAASSSQAQNSQAKATAASTTAGHGRAQPHAAMARPLGEGRAQRGSRPAPPLDDGAQHEYTVCAEGPGKRAAAGGGTQVRAARLGASLAEEAGA